jgi:hypothetical protein
MTAVVGIVAEPPRSPPAMFGLALRAKGQPAPLGNGGGRPNNPYSASFLNMSASMTEFAVTWAMLAAGMTPLPGD